MDTPRCEKSGCMPLEYVISTLAAAKPIELYDLQAALSSVMAARDLITEQTADTIRDLVRESPIIYVIPKEQLAARAKENEEARARAMKELGG